MTKQPTPPTFDFPEPVQAPVPSHIIPELAYALAVAGPVEELEIADFLEPFGLSTQQFSSLQRRPAFLRALEEAKSFVDEHGRSKGFKVRTRFYAEQLAEEIYQTAKSTTTDPAVRLRMFEAMAKYAGLDPMLDARQNQNAQGGGTNIVIQIGEGIRGVSAPDVPTVDVNTLEND